MADIKYYTLSFRVAGSPNTGLTPTFDIFVDAATGSSVTPIPTITEIDGGIYRFSVDWDNVGYDGVDDIALRADSEDVSDDDADRYIFGSLTRRDSESIYSLTSTINTNVDTVLEHTDVQILGDWIIEDNQLKLYLSTGSLYATFDLFDIDGSPTSTSATTRIKV